MEVTTKFPVTDIKPTSALAGGEVTGSTGVFVPLTDVLMREKFQYANSSRQKITSTCLPNTILAPCQLFIDSKQPEKKFILTGYRYDVLADDYEVEITEYDNTTPINLV